jgi:hypothetical protein
MRNYIASSYDSIGLNLLVDGQEYSADDSPNFWRTIEEEEDILPPGNILCMKCHQFVDLRISDMTLWCKCAECVVINVEMEDDIEDDENEQ